MHVFFIAKFSLTSSREAPVPLAAGYYKHIGVATGLMRGFGTFSVINNPQTDVDFAKNM